MDEKKADPKIRNPSNPDNNKPIDVIYIIAGGPNNCKGENKKGSKDVLLIEKDTLAKQEVMFGLSDRVTEISNNDLLVVSTRLNKYEVKWVFINIGCLINLLTLDIYNKLGLDKNIFNVTYRLMDLVDKTVAV